MLRLFYLILLILLIETVTKEVRQEGASVKYFNTKYISSCSAITRRQARGQPYRTNLVCTMLITMANNTTMIISYGKPNDMMTIRSKLCDLMRTKWISTFVEKYSNYSSTCPVKAGTYAFTNMELPPKNFPIPALSGDVTMKMMAEMTDTHERLLELTLTVHS